MISPRLVANLVLANVFAGAAILYRYPPGPHTLYPECPFFRLTHHLCPGCGATRAMYALLHGRLFEAFHYNALLMALVPFLLAYFAVAYWRAITQKEFSWPQIPAPAPKYVVLLVSAFALIRLAVQQTL